MRVLQPSRARLLAAVVTVAAAALMSASSAFAWTSSDPLLSGQPRLNPNPFGYSGWYTGPVTVTYTFEQKGVDILGVDYEIFQTMTCSGTDGGAPTTYDNFDVNPSPTSWSAW